MTDTELSKITKIPLSTINGYKKSDNYKLLLYKVLKKVPNLESLYADVINEQKEKKTKWSIRSLYETISKLEEYKNYDFFTKDSKENGPLGPATTIMPFIFDCYAVDDEKNFILFDFRPTLLYGKKLEEIMDKMISVLGESYNSVEVCLLTYKLTERVVDKKYNLKIKSISEVLNIDVDKLLLKGIE